MSNNYQDFFKKAAQNSKGTQLNVSLQSKPKNKAVRVVVKKKSKSTNLILFVIVGFLFTLVAFLYLDDLDTIISKVDISFLVKAKAESAEVKSSDNKDVAVLNNKEDTSSAKDDSEPAAPKVQQKNYSETELNHFARLSDRKIELDQREKEIQKMEVEISKQKEEIEKKMVELEAMRKKISAVLEEKVQVDDKRIDNLVLFYSAMKPQQAAKVVENLDEGLAVEVLARMKKKSAADIMNLLKAEKAQAISEKYAGYRK